LDQQWVDFSFENSYLIELFFKDLSENPKYRTPDNAVTLFENGATILVKIDPTKRFSSDSRYSNFFCVSHKQRQKVPMARFDRVCYNPQTTGRWSELTQSIRAILENPTP
jgi:hypothetical protein